MNNVLQIFLGSLPVLIAAIIVLIVKKKKLVPIAAIAIQLVVAITAVIFIGNNKMELSNTEAIDMFNVYNSIKNNPSQAENMLVKKNTFAGSIKYTLAKARLLALKGKWEEATALYKKVDSVDDSLLDKREKELLEKLQEGKIFTAKMLSYNVGNANYLKSKGQNPKDYGFVELSSEEIKENTKRTYPQLGENLGWKISNENYYYKKGITWSGVTSGAFSCRCYEEGFIFDSGANGLFAYIEDDRLYLAGLLNTKMANDFLKIINPTINTGSGTLNQVPVLMDCKSKNVISYSVKKTVEMSIADWDSYETSWDFKRNPLV